MSWRAVDTQALGSVREVADAPRTIEGLAVPYGVVSADTEFGKEAFYPGAFSVSVQHWMTREDGGRMAFRPKHGADPNGIVTVLRDTPEGVRFRAEIDESPDGDKYLQQVRKGLNGVSIEVGLPKDSKRGRDGTVIHREGRLFAIAGSVSPAYDGARIALRDMEALMNEETPAPTPEPTPPTPEPSERAAATNLIELTPALRSAIERIDAGQYRAPAVVTREAQIYRRDATWSGEDERGNRYTYLSDGWKARNGDTSAAERQNRYERLVHDIEVKMEREAQVSERAGDVLSTEIVGSYPNDYVPTLFTPRILKGRPLGSFFTRFPISDALPKIYPKTGTSTTVAVQSAEGANPAASDFTTTAITVTPALYGAETVVSRQVLDGSSPAAEAMVLQDMLEAYAQASETVIKTAVEAGATASGQAITAATPFAGLVANVVAYSSARFLAAEGQFIPSALWAVAAKQPDTGSLRPLLSPINPQNAAGVLTGGTLGAMLLGADVFHSYASTVNVVVTARRDDYVIFESAIARFSYDAVTGPSGVRIGIWAYLAAAARKGGLSVTAA
jgi:phage head maturation protease